jgi:hypothetical protein
MKIWILMILKHLHQRFLLIRNIFHVDATQTFKSLPNTEFKFRFATVDADPAYTSATVQSTVDNNSYNEYRFEINYLF